jgi:hypothetical protein
VADAQALGGAYIAAPEGSGDQLNPDGAAGTAVFQFNLASPGTYTIWGLENSPAASSNSFWIQIDGGVWQNWTCYRRPGMSWTWDRVNGSVDPLLFQLSAGAHTLRIQVREDGAQLDQLILSNDPSFLPSGAPLDLPRRQAGSSGGLQMSNLGG